MGCLKRIIGLVIIVVVVALVYLNRDKITSKWHGLREGKDNVALLPSAALADSAARKIAALQNGKSQRVTLSEVELQSLLRYKFRQMLPAFVDSPRIQLKGSKIQVSGRVPVDRLPQVTELGEAADFLPDTTELSVIGELLPLRTGRVALTVDEVKAARIPLPHRLVPKALRSLGRKDEPGLPSDAMAVPLPAGATAAYVRNDTLVFIGKH